jgi:hypothetical protein
MDPTEGELRVMDTPTDCTVHGAFRRLGWGLIFVVVIGQSGCAKFKTWRQNSFPASNQPVEFGTDFPPINDKRPGFNSGPPAVISDPYLQRFGRPTANPGPAPADPAAAKPAEIIPTATRRSTDHPQIALSAPSALPLATEPSLESMPAPAPAPALSPQPEPELVRSSNNQARVAPQPSGPTLAAVIQQSREAVDKLSTYQVSMNHQERVNGIVQPAEEILMSVRRNPKAIRIEWPEGSHKGREVIYLADAGAGKGIMHVHMGDSLLPVPDMKMPPDSPLAMSNSRHPISEAGYETVVDRLQSYLRPQAVGSGDAVKFTYEGREQPPGLDKSCHKILRVNAAREQWLVYIDPDTHLPALIQGTAANGDLVERHLFRDPVLDRPDLLKPEAFDPIARWGQPKGFFQKLARAGASNPDAAKPK